MLTHIHIWNFAIVEQLDLEVEDGLTVLTGETGAGKSILLDALSLALGDRADSSVIRHGAEKAEISVTFQIGAGSEAQSWLNANDLESADECIIRRIINAKGSSRAFINGKPMPVQSLKELGEMLVDLHGQHEHQSLLRPETQRQLLDDYAGHDKPLKQLAHAYETWRERQQQLAQLRQAATDRDARLELLRYQVDELQTLELAEGEIAALETEHRRLANTHRLLETGNQILYRLSDEEQDTIGNQLQQTSKDLQQLAETDETLNGTAEMLENANIQVQEAIVELRHYLDALEMDPQRLEWIEQRLSIIQELSRKHKVEAQGLTDLLPRLQEEFTALQEADTRADQLQQEVDAALAEYRKLATQLSRKRSKAAKSLATAVSERMQTLGMEGGRFDVTLEPLAKETPSLLGMERIEFVVSANPGQPLKPLNKVASGGELSRISLAIQVITAQNSRIPTLIFDEVDVGIGGRVAEIVGHLLRTLTQHRQVLCVTHLPQVAALGHHHLQVSKQSDTNTTQSQIQSLEQNQRIEELARMLGGIEITEQTRSHAREMIERAQT